MEFIIEKNPDNEFYENITKAVKENDGYCPCLLTKDSDTKCICKDFREQDHEGFCHCQRYIKVKK